MIEALCKFRLLRHKLIPNRFSEFLLTPVKSFNFHFEQGVFVLKVEKKTLWKLHLLRIINRFVEASMLLVQMFKTNGGIRSKIKLKTGNVRIQKR